MSANIKSSSLPLTRESGRITSSSRRREAVFGDVLCSLLYLPSCYCSALVDESGSGNQRLVSEGTAPRKERGGLGGLDVRVEMRRLVCAGMLVTGGRGWWWKDDGWSSKHDGPYR